MAHAKNYLPFAAREVFYLAANSTRATKISSLAMGSREPEGKVIYQDMNVWFPDLYNAFNAPATDDGFINTVFMRYGLKNRGYLIDRPLPVGCFTNQGRPMSAAWTFLRPYTVYPGQKLHCRTIQGGNTPASGGVPAVWTGIVFNGVREKDGQPVLLHAAQHERVAPGVERDLTGTFLACPADSPVRIYGVSHHNWYHKDFNPATTVPLGIEVYGVNGQSWIQRIIAPATTTTAAEQIGCWIDPPNSLIELGPERGWTTRAHSPIVVEFENRDSSAVEFILTVRGCVEVSDE